jgi:hypothetical protein
MSRTSSQTIPGVRLAKEVKEAPLWGPSGPDKRCRGGRCAELSRMYAFLGRFVAYPPDHAHARHAKLRARDGAWDSTPLSA